MRILRLPDDPVRRREDRALEEAVRLAGSTQLAPGGESRILTLRQPIGVALLVTPWNFLAAMATRKIAPALAAGCTVVLKPASETPLTALALASVLHRAGVPAGVVNVVPTAASGPVVSAILECEHVRKLSFTGSTEVGRVLLKLAADRVQATSMELGGNAPFIVFDDADVENAVTGAMTAKMRNGGQACTAANRFYVHDRIADQFAGKLSAAMARLRLGPGTDAVTEVGPLINESARAKIAELVDAARDGGAHVLTGAKSPAGSGFFYAPTVLDHVSADARVVNEESFGPVAPIVRFDKEEEILELANTCELGLASYVYTADLSRALRVAESLEAGMVGINRGMLSNPAALFGGVKQSGLGREGGQEGMLEYTETKYIAVTW